MCVAVKVLSYYDDVTVFSHIPYSWQIWRELNLAKSPKTAKMKYWRNLNLAIAYGEGYLLLNLAIYIT